MLSSEILNSAADLLEQHDWLQHRLAINRDGGIVQPTDPTACGFCLLGAIFHFTDEVADWPRIPHPNGQSAKDAVSRVLGLEPDRNGMLSEYNDAPGRTKQQVIEILREAARQEQAAGR
jgi:hypothetical protein